MTHIEAEVAIVGAGFAGSLLALMLERTGRTCVLLERDAHPRFAIGESSTPQADLALESIAETYDLPWLAPFARYGPWCRAHPTVSRGCKRGFSYFHHVDGRAFSPDAEHTGELLVAASSNDETADTHWYRPEFDAHLVDRVQGAGVPYLDHTRITHLADGPRWRLEADRLGEPISIDASFVVDATGGVRLLVETLGLRDDVSSVHTNSRAIYGHFRGVRPWGEVLVELGANVADHPYPAHAAAVHHVFDGGWMYVLHFDNGITSAGFVLDLERTPRPATTTPDQEWKTLLARFPSLAAQFQDAAPTRPIQRTGRLQRRITTAVGTNWALLPGTAGFVDPLHSSGNAQSLWGIERLARALATDGATRAARLAAYDDALRREHALIDLLVHGSYAGFARFDLLASFALLYFAGAHTCEHLRRGGVEASELLFLNAHDDAFVDVVRRHHVEVTRLASGHATPADLRAFQASVVEAIEPWNRAELGDPARRNLYECV